MIKQWLKNKKERSDIEQYRNGFSWAMCSYYLDNISKEEIESYIIDVHHPFDAGARDALKQIK